MQFPDARLLIFAKAPVPGQVKTRLIPQLGITGATDLHQRLVIETLTMASTENLFPIELWCAPDTQHAFFSDCKKKFPLTLHPQQGHDLGQRMHHALRTALSRCQHAILIGSDCPVMQSDYLTDALTTLQNKNDVVIGPAEDGGYVLIGMNKPAAAVFNDMPWGSDQVLAQTRQQLKQQHLRWQELALLWDVDRHPDWLRYQQQRLPHAQT